ncbi:hypothetical protein ACFOWX_04200 [Sphingorhabdus arenilitoris]|uniref:DUF2867 domain-containing protein n=1 Tax=Sphingorhabdus arenilitoris TaxID=1490041 RepID=A0ABV8RE26_9SPHN
MMPMPHMLPDNALHRHYRDEGGYADCYHVKVSTVVTLNEFVQAFYTSRLFKFERLILRLLIAKPSTDHQARLLAHGEIENFSAWTVETRSEGQLLMRDYKGMTLSWFMVTEDQGSKLFFGTAIVRAKGNGSRIPRLFSATLWFHKLYSRALLWSAVRNLPTT